jgi:hypothetical protein
MAGNVYAKMTPISMCEALTGWATTGTGTLAVADNTIYDPIQGTYNLQDYKASAGNRGADYDLGAGGTDLTGKAIYCWFSFNRTSILQVKGSTGLRIRVTDTSGNYSEWDIAGSDTLPHAGWIAYCIELASTPSRISGTLIKTAVRYVGYKADTVAAKGFIYFDAWRYGTGLTITGGNEGAPVALSDLNAADTPNPSGNTNAYGVVQYLNGIYFIQGQINIGYETGATAESTYFKDTSKIVVFKSSTTVTDTFYRIYGQGTSSYITKIYFGTKSGSQGISGLVVMSQSSSYRYTMDFSDTDVTYYGLYGCTFIRASTITLPAYNINKEVLSCTFETCAKVIASTAIITYSKFLNSTGDALQFNSTSHHVTYTDFIACQTAIEITVAGPFTYNSLSFSSCTYDGHNTYGSTIAVSYDSGCSPAPSTYDPAGSVITYATSVTLTVRHVKSGSEPTNYAVVAIYKASDMTQIMDTDASTADDQNAGYYKASTSYETTGIAVKVRARYKGYLPFEVTLTIPANGLDVTAIWIADPNYTP